jgi:ubiquitin C-terminal hydrolase
MLKKHLVGEPGDYRCGKCNKRGFCTQHTLLSKMPKILIFHLRRFNAGSEKVKNSIDFPVNLDIVENTEHLLRYELYGIVSHIGEGLDEGHFIA